MKLKLPLLLLSLIILSASSLLAQCRLDNKQLLVKTTRGALTFSTTAPSFTATVLPLKGEFVLRDGRPAGPLPLPALENLKLQGPQAVATSKLPGLDLSFTTAANGPWVDVTVAIHNTGAQQRWLEPGWRMTSATRDVTMFEGSGRPFPGTRDIINERLPGQFPVAALYNKQACFAVGISPDQTFSYFRRSMKGEGDSLVWENVNRIVVDPGETVRLRYLLAPLSTTWGFREMLQEYYRRYPQSFVATPGVDPRANLNGASYLAWTTNPDAELCRRLRAGWEWCYAPFRRTGDIVGRPELWDYEPVRPMSTDRLVPREQYLETRRQKFAAGQNMADVGMMFYIPSQIWCEERLAKELYPDSLITDKGVKLYFDTPWVTGHDNELRVFPMNTSFGKRSREDMAQVSRDLELAGFAFDTANGGAKYYGPAVNSCPGRSWDTNGVYVDEAVAIADLMHYVHTLPGKYGYKQAVVANPGAPTYLTAFACDSSMIEADPTSVVDGQSPSQRYALGHKTMVFWENYELEDLLDSGLTPEQMRAAMDGLADYTILSSLRLSALPTPRIAIGNRKLGQWLPLLTDIAQAGWQPVPAATTDDRLFVTRSGEGLDTYLASGNETADTITSALDVHNNFLGEGAFLFAAQNGAATETQVKQGRSAVAISLKSREPGVWRAGAQLIPAAAAAATTSVERHADRTVIKLDLRPTATLKSRLRFALPPDHKLVSVTLNGKPLSMTTHPDYVEAPLYVPAGATARLEARFTSTTFGTPEETILALPWLRDKQVAFAIVANGKTPEEQYAVQRLAGYFPYYLKAAQQVPSPTDTPIVVEGQPLPQSLVVRVQVDPNQPTPQRIALQTPQRLVVSGKTPADVKAAMYKLLSLLDKQYPYAGRLPATPLFKSTGVAGHEMSVSP
ncbi:MAG: hypothetical protein ACYC63_13005 [Armatimonadota bacterium]